MRQEILWLVSKARIIVKSASPLPAAPRLEFLCVIHSIAGQILVMQFMKQEGGQCIGVSKRCCPVCAHLLTILKTREGMPYIITGKHSKVTACSLPRSLSKDFIDNMISEFGMQLRKELVLLMQGAEGRSRTHSLDSRHLSIDSHDSYIAPTPMVNLYDD